MKTRTAVNKQLGNVPSGKKTLKEATKMRTAPNRKLSKEEVVQKKMKS